MVKNLFIFFIFFLVTIIQKPTPPVVEEPVPDPSEEPPEEPPEDVNTENQAEQVDELAKQDDKTTTPLSKAKKRKNAKSQRWKKVKKMRSR